MKLYYVQCEYDIGLNLEGYSGVYSSQDRLEEVLSSIDYEPLETTREELEDEGLLNVEVIEG